MIGADCVQLYLRPVITLINLVGAFRRRPEDTITHRDCLDFYKKLL